MLSILLIAADKKTAYKYINSNFLGTDDLFFEVLPAATKYSIAEVKEIIKQTFIFNPKKRVYFFPDFHTSSLEAQNAFLKGLEEAPDNVLFILSADSVSRLLPTIVSRTKVINLGKISDFPKDAKIQAHLDKLIDKKNFADLDLKSFDAKTKEEAIALIDQVVYFFRNRLPEDPKAPILLKETIRQRHLAENNNLTPQLMIDHILIFTAKLYNMKL